MTDSLYSGGERDAIRSVPRLGGSPPNLPEGNPAKRFTDRLLPRGIWLCLSFVAIAFGVTAATQLPGRPGLALGAVITLAASAYCLSNFRRCRAAHCIVSGAGWAALTLFEFIEIAVGRSLIHREEGLAFLAILVAAVCFEALWRAAYGTNAVTSKARQQRHATR